MSNTWKMDDKKLLVESTYETDNFDALLETGQNRTTEEWARHTVGAEQNSRRSHSPLLKTIVVICLSLFVALALVLTVGVVCTAFRDESAKFMTSFVGKHGQRIDQEVFTFHRENVIKYEVRLSPTKQMTVIDDFNRDLQIIKIVSPEDQICYVSELGKDSYVPPADVVFSSKDDKGYKSRVYETGDAPIEDLSVLGSNGQKLCQGTVTYWIYVVQGTEMSISSGNFTGTFSSSESGSDEMGGVDGSAEGRVMRSRTRRNIRQCHTSCCWLVCCCDVEHFTWERVEHFTCNHVCHKCTSDYKKLIRQLCTH